MTYSGTVKTPLSGPHQSRPFIASYDLGYEFSQEHYIELQCMVDDAAEEDDDKATFAYPQLHEAA